MSSEKIKGEYVIHWKEVFKFILKKWWIIVLSAIVGGVLGIVFGIVSYQPVYESQAVYLVAYSGGDSSSAGDLTVEYGYVSKILVNCVQVARQNKFMLLLESNLNPGIDEDSPDYISAEDLNDYITYSYASSATIISVSVKTDDPAKSYKIINAITDCFSEYLSDNYQLTDRESLVFNLINTPVEAEKPLESSSKLMFGIMGAVAFAIIAVGILFIIALADSRIKREVDLTDKYNIPILGMLPYFEEEKTNKERERV